MNIPWKRWSLVLISAAGVFLGQGAVTQAQHRSRGLVPRAERIVLEITVRARQGARRFELTEGSTLRTGDGVALEVTSSRPAYVYVAYVDSRGVAQRLYPTSNRDQLVEPGRMVRMPATGDEFALDENTGTERVIVIASPSSLRQSDAQLDRIFQRAIDGTEARAHSRRSPPGVALVGLRSRGLRLSAEPDAQPAPAAAPRAPADTGRRSQGGVRWQADEQGIGVWTFSFHHI